MRSIRWLCTLGMALLVLVVMNSSNDSAQAASSLTVNKPSNTNPGRVVTISGEAPWADVVIKVVLPNETVLYFDVATVVDGKYTSSFQLGQAAAIGTYQVIVGRGNDVVTQHFSVSAGTSNNGNVEVDLIDGEEPFTVKASIEEKTYANGQLQASYTVSKGDLIEAIKKAIAAGHNNPIVSLSIGDQYESWEVKISLDALSAASDLENTASIQIKQKQVNYTFKLSKEALQAIQSILPNAKDVTIAWNQVTEDVRKQMLKQQNQTIIPLGQLNISTSNDAKSILLTGKATGSPILSIITKGQIDPLISTVALYDEVNNSYTFVPATFMKKNGQTIVNIHYSGSGTFVIVTSAKTFDDVTNHWAKSYIERSASKLLVTGRTNALFAPNEEITRAEVVTVLVRVLGLQSNNSYESFNDVTANAWYAKAIQIATSEGIVEGYSDGSFKPNQPVSREELAVIIKRVMNNIGISLSTEMDTAFADDIQIHSWAKESVYALKQAGIVTGKSNGQFKPGATATRAEAVAMIVRMLEKSGMIN